MAIWPESLPAPQRKLKVEAGTNIVRRKLQTGRHESLRFGTGAPDKASVIFRFFKNDVEIFKHFYSRLANHGTNWFSAPWLSAMGYADHQGRFLGYPVCQKRGTYFSDFEATLLIQQDAHCPEDTFWPTDSDGGGSGPGPPREGLVTAWGDSFTFNHSSYFPVGLLAVKVVISSSGHQGAALLANGNVWLWGSALSSFPGWEGLTDIQDIAFAGNELLLLDAAGAVSSMGYGDANIKNNIPAVVGATGIWGAKYLAAVKKSDGILEYWGVSGWVAETSTVVNPIHVSGQSGWASAPNGIMAIDENGVLLAGGPLQGGVPAVNNGVLSALAGDYGHTGCYQGIVLLEDGTWQGWGTYGAQLEANVPPGLVPSTLTGGVSSFLAIHQDDTVVTWGVNHMMSTGVVTDLPLGLRASQGVIMGNINTSSWVYTSAGAVIAI